MRHGPLLVALGILVGAVLVRQLVVLVENQRLLSEVAQEAFRDSLTGLANRAHFLERLDQAVARRNGDAEPIAVLCLDLDNFKSVNDALGHPAGDELLIRVAGRLSCRRWGRGHCRTAGWRRIRDADRGFGRRVASSGPAGAGLVRHSDGDRRRSDHGAPEHRVDRGCRGVELDASTSCCGTPTWRCTPRNGKAENASAASSPICRSRIPFRRSAIRRRPINPLSPFPPRLRVARRRRQIPTSRLRRATDHRMRMRFTGPRWQSGLPWRCWCSARSRTPR